MVEKYFGTIPRGPGIPDPHFEIPRTTGVKRSILTDSVELPRVYLAWISPKVFTQGDATASLAARMLGGGKASRLYRDLVHDLQIAQSVVAEHVGLSHGSVFQITATAKPGHTAEQLEKTIHLVLERMAREGPGEKELAAAKVSTAAIVLKSLEPSGGVADRLNAYNHFVGTPDFLARDLQRFESVTEERVRRFVAGTLRADRGVVVAVHPGPKVLPPDPPTPATPPEPSVPPTAAPQSWRSEVPQRGKPPASRLPVPESFRLGNGLTVFLVRRPQVPLVTVQVTARSGSSEDPNDLRGLASFTAGMLNEGAGERRAIEIANDLAEMGSTLETGSSREATWAVAQLLKSNLDATTAILSDVVLRPTFPVSEVARLRVERLATLKQQQTQPLTTANKVMWREQYGVHHPYASLTTGTEDGIRGISRDDITAFHRRAFRPANAALILTGDVTLEEARRLAERHFGRWGGNPVRREPLPPAVPSADRVLLVDMPCAPQTALVFSQPGVPREDPRYDRLLILNGVLGELFSSRLNQQLREVRGFTYGVDSQVTQSPYRGLLQVSMSVDKQQSAASVNDTLAEVAKLKEEGMSAVELGEARDAIVRSTPNRFRTNGSLASSIAHLYALGIPQSYFRDLGRRLSTVTLDEMNRLSRELLLPDQMKIVAVGDRAVLEVQLQNANLGPIALRHPDASP